MMRNLQKYTAMALLATAVLSSCKKEYDSPPLNTIPVGNILTIDSLRHLFTGTPVHFSDDYSVYGVITDDEVDGNQYKNVFLQNGSAAINVRLMNSGGLYIGDSIRINLKGTVLSKYNGMMQLDSVDVNTNVVKQAVGVVVQPLDVNVTDINTNLQSRLVRINGVEFITSDVGHTYSDAVNQTTQNRTLTDCSGNTIIVRTSGFANYAAQPVASGHGSLVAIVGEYSGTFQLYIQKYSSINMTGARCSGNPPIMSKDFEDNSATSGGWSIQNVSGAVNWATNGVGASSGSYYGQCSNYSGGTNHACETWLISPSVNLSATVNPALNFINAYKYTGAAMEVYISTNYVSGLPSTATWTQLTGWTASPGSFTWVPASVNLSSYKMSNVHVAFKYTGSGSDGSTWEIDDVQISEM